MKRKSKSEKSKFEKSFQTSLTFKRNKSQDKQYSVKRRRPVKSNDQYIQTKIHSSFMNSTAQFTQRRQKNLDRFKSRLSCSHSRSSVQCQQSPQVTNGKKTRSFSMQKMTSRQYIHNLKNKPILDQRLFNNYSEIKPDIVHTSDFSKRKGKKLDNRLKYVNDIYHETQKLYQDYYYSRLTNQTRVNYRAQRKLKSDRVFFIEKRPQNKSSNDLSPQNIDKGLKIASHFKNSNICNSNIESFYQNSGRQLPCQFDMRGMTQLTNYWKGQNDKIERPKLDYGQRKMKEDLIDQKKEKMKKSKKVEIDRKNICDSRFFKYFKKN